MSFESGIILANQNQEFDNPLALQTTQKRDIENHRQTIVLQNEVEVEERLRNRYGTDSIHLGNPNPSYNCHGLTFASRRTGIFRDTEVKKILDDDYMEIKSAKDVWIGDIIVYVDIKGYTHSGIVIKKSDNGGVNTRYIYIE